VSFRDRSSFCEMLIFRSVSFVVVVVVVVVAVEEEEQESFSPFGFWLLVLSFRCCCCCCCCSSMVLSRLPPYSYNEPSSFFSSSLILSHFSTSITHLISFMY